MREKHNSSTSLRMAVAVLSSVASNLRSIWISASFGRHVDQRKSTGPTAELVYVMQYPHLRILDLIVFV
jgi:hypothetical protein